MNKSTKGALAATAAGVLLLGGAGSLAYWTAEGTVSGGSISAGDLSLGNAACGSDWTFDGGEVTGGAPFTNNSKIVPGDVITKTCTFTIVAKGEHLRAVVRPITPALNGDLANALTVDATNVKVNGVAGTTITDANDGQQLEVTVAVTFNSASGNGSKLLDATLNDITVTADQVHS